MENATIQITGKMTSGGDLKPSAASVSHQNHQNRPSSVRFIKSLELQAAAVDDGPAHPDAGADVDCGVELAVGEGAGV